MARPLPPTSWLNAWYSMPSAKPKPKKEILSWWRISEWRLESVWLINKEIWSLVTVNPCAFKEARMALLSLFTSFGLATFAFLVLTVESIESVTEIKSSFELVAAREWHFAFVLE